MVIVRRAQKGDGKGIVAVHKKSWLATYPNTSFDITKEKIEKLFLNSEIRIERWEKRIESYDWVENGIWIAEEDEQIVGFIAPAIMDEKRRVGAIYIDPAYIGKGIGGELMMKVLQLYKGFPIYCDVASYNIRAQEFYEKQGFICTGKESSMDFEHEKEVLFSVPLKEYVRH